MIKIIIAIAALVTLVILLIVGWSLGINLATSVTLILIENGVYISMVALGSIAWVCLCVGLYIFVEWLIAKFASSFHANG
jgi:hypothetical protein